MISRLRSTTIRMIVGSCRGAELAKRKSRGLSLRHTAPSPSNLTLVKYRYHIHIQYLPDVGESTRQTAYETFASRMFEHVLPISRSFQSILVSTFDYESPFPLWLQKHLSLLASSHFTSLHFTSRSPHITYTHSQFTPFAL